jgi:hypothetical protein
MKYLAILLSLSFSAFYVNANPSKEKPQIEKPKPQKNFPRHWGHPPKIQVRDQVKLPAKFGFGSSTLAKWISDNLKRDIEKGKPDSEKPKPPVKPKPPAKPQPPKEVKEKIDSYKETQKELESGLKKKLKDLGEKPSRELVRKTVDTYRKENKDIIESQKELGKKIHEWQKDSRPERPKKPEPTPEIKAKIKEVKEKEKEMHEIKKSFHETLKSTKDMTKEQREEVIKDFKEKNADKHKAIKDAQKELQKQIRELKQTGDRRQ